MREGGKRCDNQRSCICASEKTCIDNIDALGNISQDLKVLKDYLTSVCVPSIPFHPGAARALKEAGLWDDTFTVYGE